MPLAGTDHLSDDSPPAPADAGELWYRAPATRWFEALPIGNGRLGGMVYGGTDADRIQLSESTAWSGAPSDNDVSPTGLDQLDHIRALLFAGEHARAQKLTAEHLLGRPTSFGTNLPLPEVVIEHNDGGPVQDYRRGLSLTDGVVRSAFTRRGIRYTTEAFASHPARLIAYRLEAATPGAVSLQVSVGEGVFPLATRMENEDLVLSGRAVETLHSNGRDGVDLTIRIRLLHDGGTKTATGGRLLLDGADSATILVAIGTSWQYGQPDEDALDPLDAAASRSWPELRDAHLADVSELMRRVSIDLGSTGPDLRELPTDQRRDRLSAGEEDPELVALYFQYGRYLTIAGSRHDSPLPLALQGLWNDGLASSAPWTNDFHLDMNTQQNYWAAEATGLGECQEPLLRLVENLRLHGRDTARRLYGARGWVAHTVTNAWGYTAPGWGTGWGLNVTGGAWIAMQHWERWEYGRNVQFLRDRAYPVIKEAAEFFLDYLVPEPDHGWLVTGPSDSPENWYLTATGEECSVSMGSTCDRVFVDAIFRMCVEASERLDLDTSLRERVREARRRLPPFQIGRHGQVQEWLIDLDEAVPSHRHTSHLMALYPERQITPRGTPDLARAARVTIERREAAPGWEQTEWVEANLAVYFARLLDGDTACQHIRSLIADTSEANLLSFSAGGVAGAAQNIYSFDGNAGGTAGIAEMLLQSDGEEIELLPALPSAWPSGSVRGLRARGGLEVDLSWTGGHLDHATVRAPGPVRTRVRYRDDVHLCQVRPGRPYRIAPVR
ncbi:glycoside hydrolase N-terminal domain-containing protein [Nonomuraea sp. NEAU-A123]|uniref:glycoside hydrolase family 95 protein n=1 Tax=Nonomuraea sp. NEAU-A123 TaxID=2839649 RepID=UPI001BE485C1|nr:glycoside hydrolase N-terminal domain-containing protein [Nonomuraea sp. NEAU-A123]MBT2231933.1 glycoside hydrolase N-terminal domain-containing protein [Nonomuraea sp. NEAU-A123]